MGLLNRMIFWELLKVFSISLIGLTGLFLTGGLIQNMSQLGLSFSQVLRIIPWMIPISLPYTIPTTTLFASCVVYGRLSTDNEAVAIKAAGVDLLNILRPAILMGIVTSGITYFMATTVIPQAQQQIQQEILRDPEEVMYNWLRRERRLVGASEGYSVYVREVQGRRLIDVIVKRKSSVRFVEGIGPRVEYDYVARTREARLIVDLEEATITIDAEKWTVSSPNSSMETEGSRPEKIQLPKMFSAKNVKSRPMQFESSELLHRGDEFLKEKADFAQKLNDARKLAASDPDPTHKRGHELQELNYTNQMKECDRNLRSFVYEYHARPALAFGCLVFAIVGCPAGLWFSRSDYLSTFVVCFLPVVNIYYPLMFAGGGMARDGKIPMIFGVWLANIVLGLCGLVLCWRFIKR